jgi:hypothetical protein
MRERRNFGTNAKKPVGISLGPSIDHFVFVLANVACGLIKKGVWSLFLQHNILQIWHDRSIWLSKTLMVKILKEKSYDMELRKKDHMIWN